jgi:ribosomal protein S18 acetylase RimI-like enzyme
MNKKEINYTLENDLIPEEFINLLVRSTLGERRPIENAERIKLMIEKSDIMITARHNGKLVGISRSLSDFGFVTYLSDLAVDVDYQHQGIGKKMIEETKKLTPNAKLILLAAPAAEKYYGKIGMTQFEHCFYLNDVNDLK